MSGREVRMLVTLVVAVTAMAGLVALTTKFTVDTTARGTTPRLYGRYYGFAVPLLLVTHVIGARELARLRPRGIRAMGLGGLAATFGTWFVSRSFSLYPWDDPAAFAFSTWEGRAIIPGLAVAALLALYGSMAVSFRRWGIVYSISLATVFLLGHLATFGWQKPWSDAMAEKVAVGKAVRAMVSPDQLDRGLVVGANRHYDFSAVLFGLRAPAYVLDLPQRATLDAGRVPAGTTWIAAIGKYEIRLPWRDVVRGRGFSIGRPLVAPGAAESPPPVQPQ